MTELNERYRRPGRHWLMVGSFLAIFTLQPLLSELVSEPWSYAITPALLLVVGLAFLIRAPHAKRNYPLSGKMVLQIVCFALVVGVSAGFSAATYFETGLWWIPVASALVIFLVGFKAGEIVDRSMAYQTSQEQPPSDA